MSTARIASVHFAPVIAHRNYRGAPYKIPASTLNGEPQILLTHDLFQNDEGPHLDGTSQRQKLQYLVRGEEIARCLINEWTILGVRMEPGQHPGLWFVRDTLPVMERKQNLVDGQNLTYEEKMVVDAAGHQVFRPAEPEEYKQMLEEDEAAARKADRLYAEWCWNDGNRIYERDKNAQLVPPLYRLAAKFYGLDAPWLKEAASGMMKQCDHCTNMILKDAMLCSKCLEPNDLVKWARWKAKKDAALLDAATDPGPVPAGVHSPKVAARGPQATA